MSDLPAYINDPDAIVTASFDGQAELVRQLLIAGISPDTADEYGSTGLHEAAKQGNSLIAQVFIEAKADINRKDKDGNTPLDLALYYDHSHVVQLLTHMGAKKTEGASPIQRREDEINKGFEAKNAVERLLSLLETNKKSDQDHGSTGAQN